MSSKKERLRRRREEERQRRLERRKANPALIFALAIGLAIVLVVGGLIMFGDGP